MPPQRRQALGGGAGAAHLVMCLFAASCISVETLWHRPALHDSAVPAFTLSGPFWPGGRVSSSGGALRGNAPGIRSRPGHAGTLPLGSAGMMHVRPKPCGSKHIGRCSTRLASSARAAGGVRATMAVPMAGFIAALRKRLRSNAGGDVGNTGDFGENEVGALNVFDVRLDGSKQRRVLWDEKKGRLVTASVGSDASGERSAVSENEFTSFSTISGGYRFVRSPAQAWALVSAQVKQAFLPRGVTSDYYAFTLWRMAQRIVSSTVSVFGTQSLLLALGVKTNKVGVAAAAGWVWANAIGKFGKTAFAARYGRAFDADAKRWRLRAAVMWVVANGMEILTFVIQGVMSQGFTALVACSVSLKQISILTASATRGTFYKQFAGRNENLGDITAKGDAQVAVADLLGMVLGISCLCVCVLGVEDVCGNRQETREEGRARVRGVHVFRGGGQVQEF